MRKSKIRFICSKVKTWYILIMMKILLPGEILKPERINLVRVIFNKTKKYGKKLKFE